MAGQQRMIVPLSELKDFQVKDGDVDPRGWAVIAADGRTIGTVRDMLADREAMRVRYLEVELAGSGRRTILPIGTAELDDETDRVLFHELTPEQLDELPPYDYQSFTREYEESVVTRFGPGGGWKAERVGYDTPHFDAEAFYRKRRSRYGGMARGERLDSPLTRADERPDVVRDADELAQGTKRTGQDRRATDDRRNDDAR